VSSQRLILLLLGSFAATIGGCVAVAGVSDFAVDPCFDGCLDGSSPDGTTTTADTSTTSDTSVADTSTTDGPVVIVDAGADADAADAAPPPSPGKTDVTVSGTGVGVGKTGVVTLVAKDAAGLAVARVGGTVVFTTSGGTSVVTFGAVVDKGDGTYRATFTGVTEGTKLSVSATLDGAPLTTPAVGLRVINPVSTGLTFSLDAANADRLNNAGGKNCVASGLAQWTDLTAGSYPGTLTAFVDRCAAGSGWAGAGTPESPFRLGFDGVDDHVDFNTVNALQKYTVLAWIRKTGVGTTGTSGTGGLVNVTPILSRGTAEGETDAIDINYYLGIASTGALASDYEAVGTHGNAPLTGAIVLADNTWYMVGTTLDATAPGTRSLYVNGVVDGTLTPTLAPSGAASALLTVGGAKTTTAAGATCTVTGCGRFQGDIAVVLTYDHVLTTAEIERNCHSFSSRFGMTTCPNP